MRNVICHNRPSSPLIERQYIPSDLEKEIRYACYRLQRNIERGIPSYDIQQKPEDTVENKDTSAWGLNSGTWPQTSSLPQALRPQKDRHDSGVGIEVQQAATDGIGIFQKTGCGKPEGRHSYDPCYATSNVPSSTNGTAGQIDLPYSSGETLIGNELRVSQERQSTGQHSNIGASTGTQNDAYSKKFLDSETNSMSRIAPSLSRPHVASRLVRKKRVENLHGASVQESLDYWISNAESARSRHSWIPKTGTRPASAMDLGTSYHQRSAREAVIIDSNGLRHAMTAEEEKERHRDLQQAVREKMYSGQIGPKPAYTSMNNDSSNNCNKRASSPLPCLDVSHEEHVSTGPAEPSRMSKRKSILHRLSFLGFGKDKAGSPRKQKTDMLRNRASVGFSRIMEAV